jgi:hypothetical protein
MTARTCHAELLADMASNIESILDTKLEAWMPEDPDLQEGRGRTQRRILHLTEACVLLDVRPAFSHLERFLSTAANLDLPPPPKSARLACMIQGFVERNPGYTEQFQRLVSKLDTRGAGVPEY